MRAHSNALVASVFFVAVLISDALTAIDTTSHADVPASLRGTSLVLVCCFAAPVLIRPERGIYGWFQRPIIGTALVAVALLGVHHGGVQTRTFDALYTTLVALAVTWLFSAGGVDEMSRGSEKGNKINDAVSTSSAMLAGALLLYGSTRIMRAGLSHPAEVRNFQINPTGLHNASGTINTLGYAYASDVATISVSFGGALGIGAAIVMVYHVRELASGTGVVALQLGVAATFQLVAALAASLTFGSQIDWLPAVFGATACASGDGCDAAKTSRRFAMVNTPVAGLWMSAVGLFALAYPVSNRFKNRNEVADYVWTAAGSLFGVVALVLGLAVVIFYADFSGEGGHSDYTILVLLVAVYWSVFQDTWLGTLAAASAFAFEEILYVMNYGTWQLFSHLTHLSLVICIGLLVLHVLLQTVAFWYAPRWLEIGIGMVTAAGSSLAVGLLCASACLVVTQNGNLSSLQETDDGANFAIVFTMQHFFPFLAWAPLYTCRCEIQLLSRAQRLGVWITTVPLTGIAYLLTLVALGVPPPTATIVDSTAFAGCVVGMGILPWLAAGSV